MKIVEPKVFLIGESRIVEEGLREYLAHIGVPEWTSDAPSDIEKLIEVYGRLCYRSFKPGLNKNVTRVRGHNADYLGNILQVRHGSVIEHGSVNFIFADTSRVFTHELVRHRAGVAISQESLRFVRLDELAIWMPPALKRRPEGRSAEAHEAVLKRFVHLVEALEDFQREGAEHFGLDEEGVPFHYKKYVTSALRRLAPEGVATTIGWTANIRTIRHVIEMRTDPGAEEEIRLVFGKVGEVMRRRYPNLFSDYTVEIVDGLPWWKTDHRKV